MRALFRKIFVTPVQFPGFLLCLMILGEAVTSVNFMAGATSWPARIMWAIIALAWLRSLVESATAWFKSE